MLKKSIVSPSANVTIAFLKDFVLPLTTPLLVNRDFAFIVDNSVAANDIVKAVRQSDNILITDVMIFDVYAGKGVEDGKQSVAFTVKLQPKDKTLTDEEIEKNRKIKKWKSKLNKQKTEVDTHAGLDKKSYGKKSYNRKGRTDKFGEFDG